MSSNNTMPSTPLTVAAAGAPATAVPPMVAAPATAQQYASPLLQQIQHTQATYFPTSAPPHAGMYGSIHGANLAGDPIQAAHRARQAKLQFSQMLGNLVDNSPQRPLQNKRGKEVPSISDKDIPRVLEAIGNGRFRTSINGKECRFGSLQKAKRPGTYCGLVMKDDEEKEYVGWGEAATKHLLYKSVKTAKVLHIDPNDVRLMCGPNMFHDNVQDRLVQEIMKTTEAPSALLRLQYLCTPSNLLVGSFCEDLLEQMERKLQEQDEKNNKKFLSKEDAETKYQTKEDAAEKYATFATKEDIDAKFEAFRSDLNLHMQQQDYVRQSDPRLQRLPLMEQQLQQFGNWHTNQFPQVAHGLQQFQQAAPQLNQMYQAGPQLNQMYQGIQQFQQAGPQLNQTVQAIPQLQAQQQAQQEQLQAQQEQLQAQRTQQEQGDFDIRLTMANVLYSQAIRGERVLPNIRD